MAEAVDRIARCHIIGPMSDKSVAQKLGMKAGKTMFVAKAPTGIATLFGSVPDGAAGTAFVSM